MSKKNPIKRQAKVVIAIMDKMYEKQRDTLTWDDDFFDEFKVCVRPRIEAAIKSVYLRKKDTLNYYKTTGKGGGSWSDKQDKGARGKGLNPSNLYPIAQYFMKDAISVWNELNEIETVS